MSSSNRKLGPDYFKLFAASTVSNLGDGIGMIAYPWLASAITRNPLLIALVAVVQRMPWLLFSLPAGVITDRMNRRVLMVRANAARALLTAVVALVVLTRDDNLPGPEVVGDAATVVATDTTLYGIILAATFLLGMAEVLYDNAAQTFMPAVVHPDLLEKANGRLWSTELIANTFAGPPLGALLIAIAFALPFVVDAATFAIGAVLITLITKPQAIQAPPTETKPWKTELKDGFRWLWQHELLRPMAIILGLLNMIGALTEAVLILFAQEVLNTSPTEFALLTTGGAVGGTIGGWAAPWISKRLGPGPSLWLTLLGGSATSAVIGLASSWPLVWVVFAVFMLLAVLWNVITVSLRQTIIPDELLGRVNSVYRFFAWGMIPIGAALGGVIVTLADGPLGREMALRLPWFVASALSVALFIFAAPRLTTAKIEAARAQAMERLPSD